MVCISQIEAKSDIIDFKNSIIKNAKLLIEWIDQTGVWLRINENIRMKIKARGNNGQ
jgi:hypothetical protein